jgi:hypothetical protein
MMAKEKIHAANSNLEKIQNLVGISGRMVLAIR